MPRIEIEPGWTYEPSDFGNGYVLWRGDGYIENSYGHPILFPTLATMRRIIADCNGPPPARNEPPDSEGTSVPTPKAFLPWTWLRVWRLLFRHVT